MKISKKVLSILLCTVMILGSLAVGGEGFIDALDLLSVKASAAQCGIFTYEVTDGKVTITDCDSSASGEITIPSTLDGYTVTSIGDCAFYEYIGLKSVTIPGSVKSIGKWAFRDCTGLTSVTIGSGVTSIGDYAFSSCSSLISIHIPDSVTSIGEEAFDYCSGLTSVCIPGSIEIINFSAFDHCSSLRDVYFTGSEEQELNIEYGNDPLTGATWHYNYVHTYTVTKESTCTEAGSKIINCECGVFTESIPPLGHDYVNHDAKAPTCEEIGWEAYQTCKRCDYTSYKEIPPTGHTDEDNDGICDVCREIINAEANKAFLESKITLNIPGEATVRFRNKAAVTVTADNLPEGYTLAIYDGDTLLAQSKPGEDSVTYTTGELQKAVTLTVKALDKDGNAVTGKTDEIKVNVNKNIFTIVIALILGIFRKLPTVTVKP